MPRPRPSTGCPAPIRGTAVRGDGTDEDTLRRAGAEGADLFMAMTEGDNRNVMTSQLATEALGCHQVIAKVNDPLRARAYADLGLATLCRTNPMASAVSDYLGLGAVVRAGPLGTDRPAPGRRAPSRRDRRAGGAPAAAAGGGPGASPAAAVGASPNGSIPTPLASTTAREG